MRLNVYLISFVILAIILGTVAVAAENLTPDGEVITTSEPIDSTLIPPPPYNIASPTDAGEWLGWSNIGTTQLQGNPVYLYAAPAVVSRYPGELDVFSFNTTNWNEPTSGAQLVTKWYNYPSWGSSFVPRVAPLYGGNNPVGAAATGDGSRIDVWANGPASELYQTSWTYPNWEANWELPAGQHFPMRSETGPAVLWHGSNEYVFWVNQSNNHLMMFKWTGTGPLNGWERPVDAGAPPSRTLTSSPSVCYDTSWSYLRVYVRASDNKLWQYYGDPAYPSGFTWSEIIGGSDLRGAPSVVSRYPGAVEIFYMTTGDKLVIRSRTNFDSYTGETVLDNYAGDSDPAAAAWDQYRVDVFIQHTDGSIWQNTWKSAAPSIRSWSPMSVMAGSGNTTISIDGFNFYPNSVVYLNNPVTNTNLTLSKTFVNENSLNAVIPSSYLASPSSYWIWIDNPSLGVASEAKHSGMVSFTVTPKSNLPTDKIAIYNAGNWYMDYNGDGLFSGIDKYIPYGTTGWSAISGDWNADGYSEIGIYKDGVWYLDYDGNGTINANTKYCAFGAPGWTPIVGDWNGDGYDEIGAYSNGNWLLDQNRDYKWSAGDRSIGFGTTGWTAMVGKWHRPGT